VADSPAEARILVVDDEADNLRFYERVLRGAGQLVTAEDGSAGLKAAREGVFDLVITDQRMPGMTGVEMLAQMQGFMPNVPKVVVTAFSDVQPILMAVNACDLFGYLLKPVVPDDLKSMVSRALRHIVQTRELESTLLRLDRENDQLRRGNRELVDAGQRLVSSRQELERTIGTLREAYEQMASLAHRDELTQLWNRRRFAQSLEAEFSRCQRYKRVATLIVADVNRFKAINDRFGHPAGDAVLRELAARLVGELRVNDLAFRIGGDEFAVILPETPSASAQSVVKKLVRAMRYSIPQEPNETVGVSVGVQPTDNDSLRSADDWYALADANLYRDKFRGHT
jgi:diguanylate cyclase (GGDEF)-like protein